jgi:anti-sigma regulatory factor (Ser/Thr protein kinase)
VQSALHEPDAVPSSGSYVHIGAVLPSPAEVLTAAVPFVEEGLRAGDLTVLACPPDSAAAVAGALGERAGEVESDARICLLGTRPPDALGVVRLFLDRAAGRGSGRLRILGHVHWGGRPREWREGIRYEAAANAVLADAPLTVMCLYDATECSDTVLSGVRATHPLLLQDGEVRPNPRFREPRAFVRTLPVPREAVESGPPAFAIDDAPTLPDLRHALGAALETLVPDEEQRGDLHLAVSEVAANAFRHGTRPVSSRLWADRERIVCTISDGGRSFDDPMAGYVPAHGLDLGRGGMGLWLARKLWDTVDIVVGERGLTVRLSTQLH